MMVIMGGGMVDKKKKERPPKKQKKGGGTVMIMMGGEGYTGASGGQMGYPMLDIASQEAYPMSMDMGDMSMYPPGMEEKTPAYPPAGGMSQPMSGYGGSGGNRAYPPSMGGMSGSYGMMTGGDKCSMVVNVCEMGYQGEGAMEMMMDKMRKMMKETMKETMSQMMKKKKKKQNSGGSG